MKKKHLHLKSFSNSYKKSQIIYIFISNVYVIFTLIEIKIIIKYIYYVMMKDFNGWLDYYIAPWIYPGMVLIGVVCYFVVHIIQMKKIKKIPMEQALKNVE
jgi:putative ABC transport system permease protein